MNNHLFIQIADDIEFEDKFFDMNAWVRWLDGDDNPEYGEVLPTSVCSTPSCLAGHLVFNTDRRLYGVMVGLERLSHSDDDIDAREYLSDTLLAKTGHRYLDWHVAGAVALGLDWQDDDVKNTVREMFDNYSGPVDPEMSVPEALRKAAGATDHRGILEFWGAERHDYYDDDTDRS